MTKAICPVAAAEREKVRAARMERAVELYVGGLSAHASAERVRMTRQSLIPHLRARGIYRQPGEVIDGRPHIERPIKTEAQINRLYAFENYGHHDLKITASRTLGYIPAPHIQSYTGSSSDMCASLA